MSRRFPKSRACSQADYTKTKLKLFSPGRTGFCGHCLKISMRIDDICARLGQPGIDRHPDLMFLEKRVPRNPDEPLVQYLDRARALTGGNNRRTEYMCECGVPQSEHIGPHTETTRVGYTYLTDRLGQSVWEGDLVVLNGKQARVLQIVDGDKARLMNPGSMDPEPLEQTMVRGVQPTHPGTLQNIAKELDIVNQAERKKHHVLKLLRAACGYTSLQVHSPIHHRTTFRRAACTEFRPQYMSAASTTTSESCGKCQPAFSAAREYIYDEAVEYLMRCRIPPARGTPTHTAHSRSASTRNQRNPAEEIKREKCIDMMMGGRMFDTLQGDVIPASLHYGDEAEYAGLFPKDQKTMRLDLFGAVKKLRDANFKQMWCSQLALPPYAMKLCQRVRGMIKSIEYDTRISTVPTKDSRATVGDPIDHVTAQLWSDLESNRVEAMVSGKRRADDGDEDMAIPHPKRKATTKFRV